MQYMFEFLAPCLITILQSYLHPKNEFKSFKFTLNVAEMEFNKINAKQRQIVLKIEIYFKFQSLMINEKNKIIFDVKYYIPNKKVISFLNVTE